MVLTVTINPLLEKRFSYSKIEFGKVNRSATEKFCAGGKGININRQLNLLGISNQAITFAGGNNGKIFRRVLAEEGINSVLVPMKSELRWSATIEEKDLKRTTHFFSPNHVITENEATDFISRLEKMIPNASIVVLAGSTPNEEAINVFRKAIEIAHREDKIVILDTYGNHLPELINMAPMIVHNNLDEINSSFDVNISSEEEICSFLQTLYSKGVKLAFITNGKENFYAMKFGFLYKINTILIDDEIDPTGSGDAFNCGVAYGLEKGLTFDEFVNLGCKLGAANAAMWETCKVDSKTLDSFPDVEITNIGKRLKLIDDSPTI